MYNIGMLLWFADNGFYYDAIKTGFIINMILYTWCIVRICNSKSKQNIRSICYGSPWDYKPVNDNDNIVNCRKKLFFGILKYYTYLKHVRKIK